MRLERQPAVEVAALPAATPGVSPVDGVFGLDRVAPPPAGPRPELATAVAAVLDEGGEFGVGDGRAPDRERLDLDGVRPLLVVEDEGQVAARPEHEGAAGHPAVARERASAAGRRDGRKRRGRIGQRLPGVGERLVVHVLVEDREEVEVPFRGRRLACREALLDARQDGLEVAKRLAHGRKREVPPRVVRDPARVVEAVAVGPERRLVASAAERPELLEPADVADLPTQRVDGRQSRAHELLVAEPVDERDRARARVAVPRDEPRCRAVGLAALLVRHASEP